MVAFQRQLDPAWQLDPVWAWQPYVPTDANPWNLRRAAHLYRRAAFGATAAQLKAAISRPPLEVVGELVRDAKAHAGLEPELDALARTILAGGDEKQLPAWWTYVLLHTSHPLRERMTLFWHGHFATSLEKVQDSRLLLEQNRQLRGEALGDFRQLVQAICRDPAMLIYLDSATNRKSHPNENFARELMELFCLGEGNYSEKDIQELARCFTGWEVKLGQFRFNRFQHDAGEKLIFGRRHAFPEGEAADWILEQPSAARFIAGKLFRQFVCDEPAAPAALLEPLAHELRDSHWQLEPVVRRILGSNLFFSRHAVGRKVRSPVDLAIGLLRSLEATADAYGLAEDLRQNGEGLFAPPNVKGWDGGRAWINASTLLGRANMVGRLLRDEKTRFAGGKLTRYLEQFAIASPELLVDWLGELLLAVPLAEPARAGLIKLAAKRAHFEQFVPEVVHALATLPEYQLA